MQQESHKKENSTKHEQDYYLVEGKDFEYGHAEELIDHPKHNTRIKLISKHPEKPDLHIHYSRSKQEDLSSHPSEFIGEVLIDSLLFSVQLSNERLNRAFALGLVKEEIRVFISEIKHLFSMGWLPAEIHLHKKSPTPLSSIWHKVHLGSLQV